MKVLGLDIPEHRYPERQLGEGEWGSVCETRRLMAAGHANVEVAKAFGVSASQTTRIQRNESWVE